MIVKDEDVKRVQDELLELRAENHNLKEQLENYIPRRRVRRVFKQLKGILEADINTEFKEDVEYLKEVINEIEKNGKGTYGPKLKTAIEHILSITELKDPEEKE